MVHITKPVFHINPFTCYILMWFQAFRRNIKQENYATYPERNLGQVNQNLSVLIQYVPDYF